MILRVRPGHHMLLLASRTTRWTSSPPGCHWQSSSTISSPKKQPRRDLSHGLEAFGAPDDLSCPRCSAGSGVVVFRALRQVLPMATSQLRCCVRPKRSHRKDKLVGHSSLFFYSLSCIAYFHQSSSLAGGLPAPRIIASINCALTTSLLSPIPIDM